MSKHLREIVPVYTIEEQILAEKTEWNMLEEGCREDLLAKYVTQIKALASEVADLAEKFVGYKVKNADSYIDFYSIRSHASSLMQMRDDLTMSLSHEEKRDKVNTVQSQY